MAESIMNDMYDGIINSDSSVANASIDPNTTSGPCHLKVVYYSEAVVQPTLLAIGILTNAASLIILPGTRIAQTFKICLMALALSDLCATTTGFTQMLVEVIAYEGNVPFGYWQRPAVTSYSLYFTFILFMCTSAGLVILIVVIRSLIVSKPVKARRFFTPDKTRLLCCGVFIVTAVLYMPTTLNILWQACYNDHGVDGTPYCINLFEDIPNLKTVSNSYLYVMTVIYGPLLVLIYIVCFIWIKISLDKTTKMLQSISQRKNSIHPGGRKTSKKHLSKTARITRTLLVILVLDTICTLPQVIQGVGLIAAPTTTIFDNDSCWYDIFDVVVEIFLCLRPTYNFWLYVYAHREFRERCRYQLLRVRFFCCRGPCKLEHKPREMHSSAETHSGSNVRASTPDHGSRCSISNANSMNSVNSVNSDTASSVQCQTRQTPKKSRFPQFTRQGSWTRMLMLKAAFKTSANADKTSTNSDSGISGKTKKSKDLASTTYIAADVVDSDTAL